MANSDLILQELECHICLDYYEIPIRQCNRGHSFCQKCIDPKFVKNCPVCRDTITQSRNYVLENIITNMDFPCENNKAGCKYKLTKQQMLKHKVECEFRNFKCEGELFKIWNCNWQGKDVLEHFKRSHAENAHLQFNSTVSVSYNSTSDYNDIHLIPAHYQLFWYKHRIDIKKQKAYWAFQLIGPKNKAAHFYYEFEIYVESPSIRKYKITEFCHNDVEDINNIFDSEKCVAVTLKTLKHYVNDKNEYSFRFRIMKLKPDANKKTIVEQKYNKTTPIKPIR